jgi:phosphonate transport system ATP-binding protein
MSASAVFELERASVHFNGKAALDDVELTIAAGDAVAFVGPSGAGKTTLLRLLNATQRPTGGCVKVEGRCLGEHSNRELRIVRSRIGFVHQDLALIPNLRVIQNVVAGRLGRMGMLESMWSMTFPSRSVAVEVHEILERVGIGEKLYERTDTLSGGQQQRVAIARALYQRPTAILADEPVSSVDPARARDTVALLTRISREEGITLCMSIHNLELAREFFPRVVGLRHGRVALDGAPADITEAQFAEMYRLSAEEMLEDGA